MKSDSAIGSLRVVPRNPKHCTGDGDDGTTTMFAKKQAMSAGIDLGPSRYVPQHRRSARGIVAGVALGTGIWILLGGIALMAWRAGWI